MNTQVYRFTINGEGLFRLGLVEAESEQEAKQIVSSLESDCKGYSVKLHKNQEVARRKLCGRKVA